MDPLILGTTAGDKKFMNGSKHGFPLHGGHAMTAYKAEEVAMKVDMPAEEKHKGKHREEDELSPPQKRRRI